VSPPSDATRGLGWDTAIDTSTGPVEVAKTGQIPGFNSELILFPSSDSGVFVSFNSRYQGSRAAEGVSAVQVAESVYEAAESGPATGS
jgi:hypothetical protein